MATEIMNFEGFTPDTRVSIQTAEQTIALSPNDVLKWIAPGAPLQEAMKFLLICRATGLNPFLGEIYFVKMGDKWAPFIAKGGFLRRAQGHPDYDGFEAGVVVQEQARDRTGKLIPAQKTGPLIELDGEIVPEGYFLIGGWAKVYRKSISRPFKVRCSYSEYAKRTQTWEKYAGTMMVKVPLTHAIKDAFAISDSYDISELEHDMPRRSPAQAAEFQQVMEARVVRSAALGGPGPLVTGNEGDLYAGVADPCLPVEMVAKLAELRGKLEIDDANWINILSKRNVNHVGELSIVEAQWLITKLEGLASHPDVTGVLPGSVKPEPPASFPDVKPLDQEIAREATTTVEVVHEGELVGAGVTPQGYYPLPAHDIED